MYVIFYEYIGGTKGRVRGWKEPEDDEPDYDLMFVLVDELPELYRDGNVSYVDINTGDITFEPIPQPEPSGETLPDKVDRLEQENAQLRGQIEGANAEVARLNDDFTAFLEEYYLGGA
ncbi:bZIP transcription factor [Paenibacillus validus]|uniref:bZIP transcription factor n=1 Tax=Paenibacillus validus TaxID=44253 RepID=UPI000FDA1652|nr:bZIP transcription factor [Paenibacillus validus]MED4599860.1 bZIP transcription factor [Paenibacillus validus]MED4606107.1 bZIP transcription factor [Paenibacillus validus]